MDLARQQTLARLLNRMPPEEVELKEYTCSICGEKFRTLVDVRHHRRREHPGESRRNKNTIGGSVRTGGDK